MPNTFAAFRNGFTQKTRQSLVTSPKKLTARFDPRTPFLARNTRKKGYTQKRYTQRNRVHHESPTKKNLSYRSPRRARSNRTRQSRRTRVY